MPSISASALSGIQELLRVKGLSTEERAQVIADLDRAAAARTLAKLREGLSADQKSILATQEFQDVAHLGAALASMVKPEEAARCFQQAADEVVESFLETL